MAKHLTPNIGQVRSTVVFHHICSPPEEEDTVNKDGLWGLWEPGFVVSKGEVFLGSNRKV